MVLARVTGHVVASQKQQALSGQTLYIVEPLNVSGDVPALHPSGRSIVAIDTVGCGQGQVVLLVQGSSARMTEMTRELPADAIIVGIVDSAVIGQAVLHSAKD